MVGSLFSALPIEDFIPCSSGDIPDEDFIPCSSGDIPCITGITQLPIFTVCVPKAFTPEEPSFVRMAGLDPILEVVLNLVLGLRMVMPGLGFPEFDVVALLEAVGKGAWWREVGVVVAPVEVENVCVT